MILPETIEILSKRRSGTLKELAHDLGLPENMTATLSDILKARADHVSVSLENRVRVALGLAPKPKVYQLPECPSCGGAPHTGDCHGKKIVQVVVLAPGERVRSPRKPPAKWADYSVRLLAQAIAQRQPYQPEHLAVCR